MKPFYRILTYLVVIVQSFIILYLLVDKERQGCASTASRTVKSHKPETSIIEEPEKYPVVLPHDILPFRIYNCRK